MVLPVRVAVLVVFLSVPATAFAADGGVHLYLQPLPHEAERLTFTIASITAVGVGGVEHALQVRLPIVRHADAARQRLLAFGRLPAGSYTGFLITVRQAALKGPQADAALLVPDAGVRLDVPFTVGAGQAPFFWLTLRYQDSVAGDGGFRPEFSVVAPPMPIVARAGFVSNPGSNTITVFDKTLGQAAGVIDTCAGPSGMALDQRRRRLYVACSKDDEIQAIDVATGDIVERSRVSPGDRPRELALTPDGGTLVSVNAGSNSVSFFDAVSLIRQERVNVGSGAGAALVDPSGRRLFVFNTLSTSISVIDVAARTLATTITTDSPPLRGQFNRRGDRLYVVHERSPYMSVVETSQMGVAARARLRTAASAIEVDPVRGLVCVGSPDDAQIDFYDPNALMPLFSMRVAGGASFLAIDAEDSRLYMVSPERRSVTVARLADRRAFSEIDVGESPYWVAVMGER